MDTSGHKWTLVDTSGQMRTLPIALYCSLGLPTLPNGSLRFNMTLYSFCGSLWINMVPYESLWIHISLHDILQLSMTSYGIFLSQFVDIVSTSMAINGPLRIPVTHFFSLLILLAPVASFGSSQVTNVMKSKFRTYDVMMPQSIRFSNSMH